MWHTPKGFFLFCQKKIFQFESRDSFEFVNIANTVSDVNNVIILEFLNLVNTVNYCIDYKEKTTGVNKFLHYPEQKLNANFRVCIYIIPQRCPNFHEQDKHKLIQKKSSWSNYVRHLTNLCQLVGPKFPKTSDKSHASTIFETFFIF